MANQTLIARIDKKQSTDEEFLILSPAVGIVDRVPGEGVYINPLQTFMTVSVLGRKHAVQLPHDVQGWVTERFINDTWAAVDFGRPLMKISIAEAPGEQRTKGAGVGTDDAEAGLVPVRAPSQGVFYRRPSPDSPAYVDVAIERWQAETGKDAILDGDGRTFAEVKTERLGETPAAADGAHAA